jgi:hypothetical protein
MSKQPRKSAIYALFLFFLTICFPNIYSAQEPVGMLEGFVINDNGPVSGARLIIDIRTEKSRLKRTFHTNEDGSFRIYLPFGKFELTTEYKCVNRTDTLELNLVKPQNLTIVLPSENCEEKVAKENAEWEVCNQDASTSKSEVTNSDKAEIVNHVLEDILDQEPVQSTIIYGVREIIISTENINPEWVKPIDGIKIKLLSREEISVRAKRNGDISYIEFEKWQQKGSCVSVGVSMGFEKAKGSRVTNICSNGRYAHYIYRKVGDKWVRRNSSLK